MKLFKKCNYCGSRLTISWTEKFNALIQPKHRPVLSLMHNLKCFSCERTQKEKEVHYELIAFIRTSP